MNIFLSRLQMALTQTNHTRPWLANVAGINVSTITGWFLHDRFPSIDQAHAVAKAFGVSLDWLMGDDDSLVPLPSPAEQKLCRELASLDEETAQEDRRR